MSVDRVARLLRVGAVYCGVWAIVAAVPATASAADEAPRFSKSPFVFEDWSRPCAQSCSFAFYGGRFVNDAYRQIVSPFGYVPPWEIDWADSYLLAMAASRDVLRYRDLFKVELEAGAAKRFGDATSPEIWSAFLFRWIRFPWNQYVQTSVGITTGLSYAFKLDELEIERSGNGESSKLLHYLATELTFSRPERQEWELLLRFHHRSGGGEYLPKEFGLFNNTEGGAHYLTAGIRRRW